MAKSAAISVRVSDELKKAVEDAAKEDNRTVAAFVELLLTRIINKTWLLCQMALNLFQLGQITHQRIIVREQPKS